LLRRRVLLALLPLLLVFVSWLMAVATDNWLGRILRERRIGLRQLTKQKARSPWA